MRCHRLFFCLLLTIAPSLYAQRVVVRPAVVPAGDTTDHVDLAWMSVPAHAAASVTATVYDAAGRVLTSPAVTWSTSDPAVATVIGTTGTATVSARGFGSATITATARGVSGTTTACVFGAMYPYVVSVVGPPTIPLGRKRQYTAVVAATNSAVPIPCVHWSTSDPEAATVDRRGLVTGRKLSVSRSDVTAFVGVP